MRNLVLKSWMKQAFVMQYGQSYFHSNWLWPYSGKLTFHRNFPIFFFVKANINRVYFDTKPKLEKKSREVASKDRDKFMRLNVRSETLILDIIWGARFATDASSAYFEVCP